MNLDKATSQHAHHAHEAMAGGFLSCFGCREPLQTEAELREYRFCQACVDHARSNTPWDDIGVGD